MYLISKIFKNHYRSNDSKCFINKIERIINNYKKKMLLHFSNFEIFQIFKENKRILLFLFEEQIIKGKLGFAINWKAFKILNKNLFFLKEYSFFCEMLSIFFLRPSIFLIHVLKRSCNFDGSGNNYIFFPVAYVLI